MVLIISITTKSLMDSLLDETPLRMPTMKRRA